MVKKKGRAAGAGRGFYLALGAIAFIGVLALVWVLTRPAAPELALTVDPNAPVGEAQPWVMGDTAAPVTIREWADYQCPACANFAVLTEPDVRRRIVETGLARYEFYDFPLPQHRNAIPAALAAACAGEQGHYWAMHDLIFHGQDQWAFQRNPKGTFEDYARQVQGLDAGAWESCYDERRPLPRIQANAALGQQLGVGSTPTFIINGRVIPGDQGYDRLRALVDSAAAQAARAGNAGGTGGAAR